MRSRFPLPPARAACLPYALVATLAVFSSAASAQGRVVDEGTFVITRRGAANRSESFRIIRLDTNVIQATSRVSADDERLTSALMTDTLGTPIRYLLAVRDAAGKMQDSVNASVRAGRLTVLSSYAHGNESMKEYPIAAGRAVLLDDDLLHQMYFLMLAQHANGIELISPRTGRRTRGSIEPQGLEPLQIAGRSVTATHYVLASSWGRRDFWLDASTGRVLRVDFPDQGLHAVREELPR